MIFFVRFQGLKFHSTLDYLFWVISQKADIRSWVQTSNGEILGRGCKAEGIALSAEMARIAAFYKVSHTQMREADVVVEKQRKIHTQPSRRTVHFVVGCKFQVDKIHANNLVFLLLEFFFNFIFNKF